MIYRILFLSIALMSGAVVMGQKKMPNSLEKKRNWHLKSLEKDGFYGIDWYGAIEFLQAYKKKSEVVVAVIDSGVDEEHEALIHNLWTNPEEIPGKERSGVHAENAGGDFRCLSEIRRISYRKLRAASDPASYSLVTVAGYPEYPCLCRKR